ncbi:MAG TPA: hypothetical protein VMI75_38530 [Polyangiaceae bacterium]|nr:hypothetical protein [Polyangiaceae bacterium]
MRRLALSAIALSASLSAAPSGATAPPAPAPSGDMTAPTDQTLVVTLPDGVAVTLEPGTKGRWLPKTKLPSETNKWAIGYHLVLQEGEADVRMPDGPKGAHAFLVQTRAGQLTDWRGKLHVAVHDDTTTAAIYEGALVVGSNGQGFPVYDGAGILMRKGIDPDKSRAIPSAPQWDAARGAPSFLLEPAGSRGNLGVAWKPVAGAASYRVTIARDAEMKQVIDAASTTDTTYAVVERAPASGGSGGSNGSNATSACWTQVRAVGPEGIVGEPAAPRPLRVVHFSLPDGAVMGRDGSVVLPSSVGVPLDDTQGLEVAYGGASPRVTVPLFWSPLSGPLRLPRDSDVRVMHVRDPALGQEAALVLARRALRVDVEMTPRNPRAGDAVDVRAVAWDPTGRLDPAREQVTLETSLDLDPLQVAWRQAGSTWTARLQPPRTFRPTVIRVAARDAFGAEIGRGFVEIVPPTSPSR